MPSNPFIVPPGLEKKSLKQLEDIGAGLTKQKDQILGQFRDSAKKIQDQIVIQEKIERDKRNADPAHAAKAQKIG